MNSKKGKSMKKHSSELDLSQANYGIVTQG